MSFFSKRDEPYVRLDFVAAPAEPSTRTTGERREVLLILLDAEITAARTAQNMPMVDRLIDARLTVMELAGTAVPVIPGRSS